MATSILTSLFFFPFVLEFGGVLRFSYNILRLILYISLACPLLLRIQQQLTVVVVNFFLDWYIWPDFGPEIHVEAGSYLARHNEKWSLVSIN